MLLHAPSMLTHEDGLAATHIASAQHGGHGASGPAPDDAMDGERCCPICSPAACGLAPVPDATLPSLAGGVEPIDWVMGIEIAGAALEGHWYSPRGPPLLG